MSGVSRARQRKPKPRKQAKLRAKTRVGARTSPSWHAEPAYLGDILREDARVLLFVSHGDRGALRALGGRQEFVWAGRWIFPVSGERAFAKLLSALRDLGLPFVGAGPGWHPGAVFEELRERGLVLGPYKKIYWTGPGAWHVVDG